MTRKIDIPVALKRWASKHLASVSTIEMSIWDELFAILHDAPHAEWHRLLNAAGIPHEPLIKPDFSDTSDDNWYPAHNGTETPFVSRSGKRLLYCFQPSTGNHAYMDVDNDILLSDEEARIHLGTY